MLVKLNKLLERNIDKILHATISYALTYTLAGKVNANLAVGDIIADVLGIAIAFLIVGV